MAKGIASVNLECEYPRLGWSAPLRSVAAVVAARPVGEARTCPVVVT